LRYLDQFVWDKSSMTHFQIMEVIVILSSAENMLSVQEEEVEKSLPKVSGVIRR
jgi:hypothetical protein